MQAAAVERWQLTDIVSTSKALLNALFWVSGCLCLFFAIPRRASRRTHAGNIARSPTIPARAPSIPPQPLPMPRKAA